MLSAYNIPALLRHVAKRMDKHHTMHAALGIHASIHVRDQVQYIMQHMEVQHGDNT